MEHSLLSMIIQDEKVNALLQQLRQSAQENKPLNLTADEIMYVKQRFNDGIQVGEKGLHKLSFYFIQKFADIGDAHSTIIVWGRCPHIEHQDINKTYTNIELGQVMSSEYMDSMIAWSHSPLCKICKSKTNTIASFNQYRFDRDYPSGLKVMLSRIKTTSNICYKIADIVFDIDRMFQRDKIVNTYTQTLMDMYGIKLAFQNRNNIFDTLEFLKNQPEIEVIDEKNYLENHKKKSGYEAYKIVIKKEDQLFELQLQTQAMLEVERSHLRASHRTYKERQMEDRKKAGSAYQNLYDLLITAFATFPQYHYKE